MKKNKYILSIVLFMTVLVIDQIIKVCVKTGMFLGERIEITSWFSLVFVENNGMAFGWELWGGKLFLTLFRVVAVCLIAQQVRQAISSTAYSTDSSSTTRHSLRWQNFSRGDMAMVSSSMAKWSICSISPSWNGTCQLGCPSIQVNTVCSSPPSSTLPMHPSRVVS